MDVTKLIRIGSWMFFAVAVPCTVGCGATDESSDSDSPVGQARQADLSRNDLSRNALSFNDLSRNDLSRNALSSTQLSSNALTTAGLGVQLIKYVVRCALNDNVCIDVPVSATDTNVPTECVNGVCHFCGNLNLAPSWQSGPLTISQERWVSACLLAHINIDGVSIPISVRDAVSGNIADAKPPESNSYDAPEAAFFGNIFRTDANGNYIKGVCNAGASVTPPGRVCGLDAAGAVSCAMTFAGSCLGHSIVEPPSASDPPPACDVVDAAPNGAVRQCHSSTGEAWDEVITIYDHQMCGDGLCSGHETWGNCSEDCQLKPLQN